MGCGPVPDDGTCGDGCPFVLTEARWESFKSIHLFKYHRKKIFAYNKKARSAAR